MTQEAVVIRTFENNTAEVSVTRGTACGSNCENCEACQFQNQIKFTALNTVKAVKGQKVEISCKSSKLYKAMALVYVFPIILLVCGYFLGSLLKLNEGISILFSFVGLIIGGFIIVYSQRKQTAIKFDYEITAIL